MHTIQTVTIRDVSLAGERCKEYRPGIIDESRTKATTTGTLKTILNVNFAIL